MRNRHRAFLAGLSFCLMSGHSLAQGVFYTPDQQPNAWDANHQAATWDITLAAGAAMQPTFLGSDRYRATPIPLAIIRWRDAVSLGADGLNLYWHHDDLRIGGGVNYDGGRQDHEPSGILSSGGRRAARSLGRCPNSHIGAQAGRERGDRDRESPAPLPASGVPDDRELDDWRQTHCET